MVNSISGIITFKTTDSVGITTGGIEWAIETSAYSLSRIPPKGHEGTIWTYLHHKEDVMKLYGFSSQEERALFLKLLTVNGVGPSLAKKILSGSTPDGLIRSLETEDLTTLAKIPGLGTKTAQKIVLQLRGKLTDDSVKDSSFGQEKEIGDALVSMGFDSRSVKAALSDILTGESLDSLSLDEREKEILRRAIVALSS